MSWDMDTASGVITFYCDTCQESHVVNIANARASTTRREPFPNLLPCWDIAHARGWVSFKRIGYAWTYHCPACADQAAADHAEWNKQEQERERIKERNARYSE